MRILDVDLKRAISDMSSEQLEELYSKIMDDFGSYEEITTTELREYVNAFRKSCNLDETNIISDEDPEILSENYSKGERKIPRGVVLNIIRGLSCIKNGSKYAQKFENMSAKEINHTDIEMIDITGDTYEGVEYPDQKYGLFNYEKGVIYNTLLGKAMVKEYVDKFSIKKIRELKRKCEDFRNDDYCSKYELNQEGENFIKTYFNMRKVEKIADTPHCCNLALVDIIEVLEARENELAKTGFWNKIKGLLFRRKTLPEPKKEDEKTKKEGSMRENLRVPEEQLKQGNNRGYRDRDVLTESKDNSKKNENSGVGEGK